MFVDVNSSFTVALKDIEMCSPAGGQGFKAPFNQGPILFEVLQKQIQYILASVSTGMCNSTD